MSDVTTIVRAEPDGGSVANALIDCVDEMVRCASGLEWLRRAEIVWGRYRYRYLTTCTRGSMHASMHTKTYLYIYEYILTQYRRQGYTVYRTGISEGYQVPEQ